MARLENDATDARALHAAACAELAALRRADFLNDRTVRGAEDGAGSTAAPAPPRTMPPPASVFVAPLSEELRKAAHLGAAEVNELFKHQYMALLAEVRASFFSCFLLVLSVLE